MFKKFTILFAVIFLTGVLYSQNSNYTRLPKHLQYSVIGIINIGTEIPKGYSLQQNYPNPFNPETSIRFNLPSQSNVELKVFDITGRVVTTLVNNEIVAPGIKEVKFNASNLASGIYFYSIKAGSFTDTKKMILVK